MRVNINGLTKQGQLNGKTATLVKFIPKEEGPDSSDRSNSIIIFRFVSDYIDCPELDNLLMNSTGFRTVLL